MNEFLVLALVLVVWLVCCFVASYIYHANRKYHGLDDEEIMMVAIWGPIGVIFGLGFLFLVVFPKKCTGK